MRKQAQFKAAPIRAMISHGLWIEFKNGTPEKEVKKRVDKYRERLASPQTPGFNPQKRTNRK